MTPLSTEQLAEIHTRALRTIEDLPQDEATKIAKLYCKFRAEGESRASAELRAYIKASKSANFNSVREKNIWTRTGLEIRIDAWFKAFKSTTI